MYVYSNVKAMNEYTAVSMTSFGGHGIYMESNSKKTFK